MGKKIEKKTSEIEEKLENEIKERRKLPDDVKKERNKNIFRNLIFACAITIFFILLNIGFFTIEKTIYCRDTIIFSFVALIVTIILLERAYRTEKGGYILHGIEVLVASIFSYFIPYTYFTYNANITKLIMASPIVFIIYYLIKIAVIWEKSSKNKKNDIEDIIKKEDIKDDDSWIKVDKEAEAEKVEDEKEEIETIPEIKVILPKEKKTTKKKAPVSTKKTATATKKSSSTKKTTGTKKTTTAKKSTATSKATTKKASAKKTTTAKKATTKKSTTKKKDSEKE